MQFLPLLSHSLIRKLTTLSGFSLLLVSSITVGYAKCPTSIGFFESSIRMATDFNGDNDPTLNLEGKTQLKETELTLKATLGKSNSLSFFIDQKISNACYIKPSVSLNKPFSLFVEDTVFSQYPTPTLSFEIAFGKKLEQSGIEGNIELGISGMTSLRTDDPLIEDANKDIWFYLSYSVDILEDYCFMPNKGFKTRAKYTTLKDINLYAIDTFLANHFINDRNTIFLSGYYGSTLNSLLIDDFFPLGGFLRISNFKNNKMFGSGVGCFNLLYYYNIDKSFFIKTAPLDTFNLYLGISGESGNYWHDKNISVDENFSNSLMLFLGIRSKMTTIFIGNRFGEQDNRVGCYIKIACPSENCWKKFEKLTA